MIEVSQIAIMLHSKDWRMWKRIGKITRTWGKSWGECGRGLVKQPELGENLGENAEEDW